LAGHGFDRFVAWMIAHLVGRCCYVTQSLGGFNPVVSGV
jgi:hypothetical protein